MDQLTLSILVVVLLFQLVVGWSQAVGGEGHCNIKWGRVKGAAPESDSVCLCPSGVYEHTLPLCERTNLDPWLRCSFSLQRREAQGEIVGSLVSGDVCAVHDLDLCCAELKDAEQRSGRKS